MEDDKNSDGLSPEELAAAITAEEEDDDLQKQIDRGDFVDGSDAGGGDDDGKGKDNGATGTESGTGDDLEKTGTGAGEIDDINVLEAVAGSGDDDQGTGDQSSHTGIPYARGNAMSREKNAAIDLNTALINGTIDTRWIADMGGQQAVIKGVAAGKIILPRVENQQSGGGQAQAHPEIAKLENELDLLGEKLAEATVDARTDEVKAIQKQINVVNRQIFKVEHQLERSAEAEQARQAAVNQDAPKVEAVMNDLWQKHSELHQDTNEYLAFIARRDNHLQKGKPMSQALTLAAQETFPSSDKAGGEVKTAEQVAKDRLSQARKKNAAANAAQPSSGGGVGVRATEAKKSIANLSDEEFEKLPEDEKAKMRGDIV